MERLEICGSLVAEIVAEIGSLVAEIWGSLVAEMEGSLVAEMEGSFVAEIEASGFFDVTIVVGGNIFRDFRSTDNTRFGNPTSVCASFFPFSRFLLVFPSFC